MKVVTVIVLVVAVAYSQQKEEVEASTKPDAPAAPPAPEGGENPSRLEKIRQYRSECIDETKVDPALIDRADNGDFATDPKLHCFSKCFYQKAGFVAENGDLLLDVIRAKIPQETDREKALAVIDKCKDLKGADACETVYLVHKCYFENTRNKE